MMPTDLVDRLRGLGMAGRLGKIVSYRTFGYCWPILPGRACSPLLAQPCSETSSVSIIHAYRAATYFQDSICCVFTFGIWAPLTFPPTGRPT
jgi:hypothetical protein